MRLDEAVPLSAEQIEVVARKDAYDTMPGKESYPADTTRDGW